MPKDFDIIERYVAVWNEADPDERRRRIRSVWAPDGSTCHRLVDAHGYDAIEERVRGSWDKWLSEGKFMFRPMHASAHHGAVKLDFAMVTVPEGGIEANGLSFLLLDGDGRIRRDYQFNPAADERYEIVDRYLAVWNESGAGTIEHQVAELWAPGGRLVHKSGVDTGCAAITAAFATDYERLWARGRRAWAGLVHAHRNVVKFRWRIAEDAGSLPVAAYTELLVLDDRGRIRCDCRFDEPV